MSSREIETRVRDLVGGGRKIEAIKAYREATGLGLAEAKRDVEAIEAGERPPSARLAPGREVVLDLLRRGRKVEAIKLHREATGADLARAEVEALMREAGITIAGGGPPWVVVAWVVVVLVVFVLVSWPAR